MTAPSEMLALVRPLSQEERLAAREAARAAIVTMSGAKPDRATFDVPQLSRYPRSIMRLITALCILLLFAAFTPSAIRLYHIGSTTFGSAISHLPSMEVVGIATILLAETGQIVFSLALAVLPSTRAVKILLYGSMGIATAIALIGNIQVALPGDWNNPFGWLEAVAPPLLVLTTAYVLKSQMLDTIEQRHAHERAYLQALAEWKQAAANPENHPRWPQFYANSLRDGLRTANKARRTLNLNELTTADWRALVWREFHTETWYEQPELPGKGGEIAPASVHENHVVLEALPLGA